MDSSDKSSRICVFKCSWETPTSKTTFLTQEATVANSLSFLGHLYLLIVCSLGLTWHGLWTQPSGALECTNLRTICGFNCITMQRQTQLYGCFSYSFKRNGYQWLHLRKENMHPKILKNRQTKSCYVLEIGWKRCKVLYVCEHKYGLETRLKLCVLSTTAVMRCLCVVSNCLPVPVSDAVLVLWMSMISQPVWQQI